MAITLWLVGFLSFLSHTPNTKEEEEEESNTIDPLWQGCAGRRVNWAPTAYKQHSRPTTEVVDGRVSNNERAGLVCAQNRGVRGSNDGCGDQPSERVSEEREGSCLFVCRSSPL